MGSIVAVVSIGIIAAAAIMMIVLFFVVALRGRRQ